MTPRRTTRQHPPIASRLAFAAVSERRGDGETTVLLRGELDAATLPVLTAILESATRTSGARVQLDLTAVTSWSLLVEAMVLSTARRLGGEGGRLVLRLPGEQLRRRGSRLGLFARIPTEGALVGDPTDGRGGNGHHEE